MCGFSQSRLATAVRSPHHRPEASCRLPLYTTFSPAGPSFAGIRLRLWILARRSRERAIVRASSSQPRRDREDGRLAENSGDHTTISCAHCGTRLPANANYCWHCGRPQGAAPGQGMARWETCEIVCARHPGALTCRFWARAIGPQGEYNAGESPWWLGGWPDKRNREAIAAQRSLVRCLSKAGWQHTGRGLLWFNDRFQRWLSGSPR